MCHLSSIIINFIIGLNDKTWEIFHDFFTVFNNSLYIKTMITVNRFVRSSHRDKCSLYLLYETIFDHYYKIFYSYWSILVSIYFFPSYLLNLYFLILCSFNLDFQKNDAMFYIPSSNLILIYFSVTWVASII